MTLKERLESEQKSYQVIMQELSIVDKRKSELVTAGVEIQGRIKLLNEMIAAESKPAETKPKE